MVSELDNLLLEHVVFSGDLDFAFGKCYTSGALNRLLGVLILIGTRAVLVTKVSSGVNISFAGFSTFAYLGFSSHCISVLNVKSWGGS